MRRYILFFLVFIVSIGAITFLLGGADTQNTATNSRQRASFLDSQTQETEVLYRLKPPKEIKALYATWGTVSRLSRVDALIETIERSGYNALVVNVKDNDGRYMGDLMKPVVRKLIKAGIYPIARIVVFQDNYLARTQPHLAIQSPTHDLWRDDGGQPWVDPTHPIVWAYNIELVKRAINIGFSEINLDYIRFPSDGKVQELVYPHYDGITTKDVALENFFRYFRDEIKRYEPSIVLSADIFGYTFLRDNGLGIGQKTGITARYFDVLSPMIYPSHFLPGNFGFENPAEEPYQVVLQTLQSGFELLEAATGTNVIVRPWIQDFDMGAVYDRERFQAQVRAIRDAGLTSGFMVWNPWNRYSAEKIREGEVTAFSP